MNTPYLDNISSPADLRDLPSEAMEPLAEELRGFLIEHVEKTGGHLASNLGVVELTMALHRVFDTPNDRIIFDVGHQSYVHKILTGRKDMFHTLRQPGGLSGFTTREESVYDPFGAGHSSTALSAAVGFAEADRLAGRKNYTIAVVGDGACTGGLVHEALNNCSPDLRLILIINENEMSISKNIGHFAHYMSKIRSSGSYARTKMHTAKTLKRIPLVGNACFEAVKNIKKSVKNILYSSNYFEELGLFYLGPADGNDYHTVEKLLHIAKNKGESVILHLRTKKGKGYAPAEHAPRRYHSVAPTRTSGETFPQAFGKELTRMASADQDIVAITAAMSNGTGLDVFRATHPDRFFDVGIAEAHAVTFASGMAAGGLKPFFAVYSTFLQRAYDNVLHDAALQNLPIRLCIDRAALSSGDGPTHHGVFDVAFLSHIPNVTLYAPASIASLQRILHEMADLSGPSAVRYPNKTEAPSLLKAFPPYDDALPFMPVRADVSPRAKVNVAIIGYGQVMEEALRAKKLLKKEGIAAGVFLLEQLKPYDMVKDEILSKLPKSVQAVIFLEEGIYDGGASMLLADRLRDDFSRRGIVHHIHAIRDRFVRPTEHVNLLADCQLRAEDIVETARRLCK